MGNPTSTDSTEVMKDDGLNTGISTRKFLKLGVGALLAIGATKATDVLGQTLPQTYDEIMAAIAEGKITYEQLLEIGKNYGSTFTSEQRKVLSGELSKLKTVEVKPLEVETVVAQNQEAALNESDEERKERLKEEKKIKDLNRDLEDLNKNFFKEGNWATTSSKGAESNIELHRDAITTSFGAKIPGKLKPKSTAYAEVSLPVGHTYKVELGDILGGGIIGIKLIGPTRTLLPLQILKKGGNEIVIPPDYGTTVLFEIENTESEPEMTVKGFNISIVQ